MNKIEQILANSLYESIQFNQKQIDILNDMVNLGIDINQVGIIAHPDITEYTYSILFDYLNSGKSITSAEFNNYISLDLTRIDTIINNVYIGKLHRLTDEQIELYANTKISNVKISRILIEKYSNIISETDLYTIMTGSLINNTFGKVIIQDLLNNNFDIKKLPIIANLYTIDSQQYEIIKSFTFEELKNCITDDTLLPANVCKALKTVCMTIDEYYKYEYEFYTNSHELRLKDYVNLGITFESVSVLNSYIYTKSMRNLDNSIAEEAFLNVNNYINSAMVNLINSYGQTVICPNTSSKIDLFDIYYFINVEHVLGLSNKLGKLPFNKIVDYVNCKNNSMDNDLIDSLFTGLSISSENYIKNILFDKLNNSTNFKIVQYDENHIFIDSINNDDLFGNHIFKFIKEDDSYTCRFSIENENISHTAFKLTTKEDVIKAIENSLELIESIDKYKNYYTELKDLIS